MSVLPPHPSIRASGSVSAENLRSEYFRRFGGKCELFRAPGRVNLIGEHTDYNDGFVMPAAIEFDTCVAFSANRSRRLYIQSLQQSESAVVDLDGPEPQPAHEWTDYVRGVARELMREGVVLSGANLLVDGRVPMGAGLSSSAALEAAVAIALLRGANAKMKKDCIASLCQRAENEFVGSRCGIMDQFASLHARSDHALLLDCRSLEFRFLPLPRDLSLVICNTMVKHSIAQSQYNARRAECEAAVGYFAARRPGTRSLRDLGEDDLRCHGGELPAVLFRRSRHVITENARVLAAAQALQSGDARLLGRLMYESHASLKNDYEVSCSEVDVMVELASKIPGICGARITGGGFGGCTINLVKRSEAAAFSRQISREYEIATGIAPEVFITSAAEGAGQINDEWLE